MTHIVLIRHGETEWNALGLYQGQKNSPLTAEGRQQAMALAERLRDEPLDALYASNLERTQETAAPLVEVSGLDLRIDPRLGERHYGIFQGLARGDVEGRHPEAHAAYTAGDPDYQIPEGESTRQFYERVVECIEELAERHAGQHIAAVTHGGTIAMVIKYVLALDLAAERRFTTANTSYNLISRQADGWMLHVLGDTSHLQTTGRDDIV